MHRQVIFLAGSVLTACIAIAAVVWLLSGGIIPAIAAPEYRPLRAPGAIITVCLSGGCDYTTIQEAVDAAREDDEIRVAAGTYTGTRTVACEQAAGVYTYTQVVFITRSLMLRGGYATSDWTTSNPHANPTVIDAQRQGRGVSIVGTYRDHPLVTVDGFTITGGDYTGLGNPPGVANRVCRSTGYDCGGGVYAYQSTLILRNSVITNSIASRSQGEGGGIYLWEVPGGSPGSRIENTTVISNSTSGRYGGGGGMYADVVDGPITITRSVFQDNYAEGVGGGMTLYDVDALVTIVETGFLSNTARTHEGGGAHIRLTENGEILRMDRVPFQGNRAGERAAALFLHAAGPYTPQARLTNLLLAGNRTSSATDADGVIGVDGAFTSLAVALAHVTAVGNHAPTFLYAEPAPYSPGHTVTVALTNTLLVSFTNGFAADEFGSGEVLIRHTNTLTDDVTALHQMVGGWPTFEATNPLTGDSKLDGTYHLLPGSAAIDAGVDAGVTTDIDGDARPQNEAPDIGADECFIYEVYLPMVLQGF